MEKPKIGAHVSTAGGLFTAFERAREIGADCIQIFGASPRMWYAKLPSGEEINKFKEEEKRSGIGPVYLHAPYLINLGTPNGDLLSKSIKNLSAHFKIAELIGAAGVIFHIGSSTGMDKKKSIEQVITAIEKVLHEVSGKSFLVIENNAGGGEKIGKTIEELAYIFEKVGSKRAKVCLDTAHAFESGIIKEYRTPDIKKFVDELDKEIGLQNIVAIHANDSKTPWNSHNDRHENIGEGHIGLAGFKELAKEKRLWDKAWLLEVPGFKDEGPDKKNVDILKSCFK
ncbi:MAG: deoxyribonuclease IV [Minisyncoccia bacterium]|jgi:deoxyribonuclease-4